MSTLDFTWNIAELGMAALYLWAAIVAIGYLWGHRRDCFICTYRQAWLRSCMLAFLVTPSLISDFFLFAFPGPAALGFALLLPGVLFASGHRLELLAMISVMYVLPWIASTAIIFYLWRFYRWRRASRGHA